MPKFPFNEKYLSQIPALMQLINLGYEYLTPDQAIEERGGRYDNVLLENILRTQLAKMNSFISRGKEHRFTPENITSAINKIKNIRYDGLVKTNEGIYDLLTLGTSLEQSIEGESRSPTLNYIDWKNPRNNVFHVTAEFQLEGQTESARPDIVLFVNGIPLAVIECKSPNVEVEKGIEQTIRNQRKEYIPKLFTYAQILVSINKNSGRYATVGTEAKMWSLWRENEIPEDEIEQNVNVPLSEEQKAVLFSGDFAKARNHFENIGQRLVTGQDKTVHSLLLQERLLEITQRFTVFDADTKKIARYQQFFVARSAIERIKHCGQGGMIWHTQGSGKSLTMVWIARLLAEELTNPQIIMVTDRIDLDKQIEKVFRHCGIEPKRATTGSHLASLIRSDTSVITTLVHKFNSAVNSGKKIDSGNIFVLVDESHRTQFGSLSGTMRSMLPNAVYIAFTGTPLTKEQKNNFARFGALIKPSYPPRQALKDGAIAPLLYEGRTVKMEQDEGAIDLWFERHTAGLNERQKADLKRKYARGNQLSKAKQVVYMKAFDISGHYRSTWQGTGLKAQLVAPDKATAIRYHRFLDEIGSVSSEVVISAPDMREGFEEVEGETTWEVRRFWDRMMERFGSEKDYNEQIIENFKYGENPEILIVVDKLLTGFDAPRNTVLYLCRTLREHTLLQAIARVNRLHEDKESGYIVDYEGIFGELDKALTMYDALSGFDNKDLEEVLTSINKEIEKLPQKYSDLWGFFSAVKNKRDEEEYERFLADEENRNEFRGLLSEYAKALAVALSSGKFLTEEDRRAISGYKNDLKRFEKLRKSVSLRYADTIDYGEHEKKIQKLLDTHIRSDNVEQVNEPTHIYKIDGEDEEGEVRQHHAEKEAATADRIAHRLKRTFKEKMDEDPEFYGQFSRLIQKAIDEFRNRRLSDSAYLEEVKKIQADFDSGKREDVPESIRPNPEACAYFGVLKPYLGEDAGDVAAEASLAFYGFLEAHFVVDFWTKDSARNKVKNDIDDYLYDEIGEKHDISLSEEEKDKIIEETMKVAKSWRK